MTSYIKFFDMFMWKIVTPSYQQFPFLLVILLEIARRATGVIWGVVVIVVASVGTTSFYHV